MSVGGKYVTAYTGGSSISGFKNVGNIAVDINPGSGDYSLGNFIGGIMSSYDSTGYVIITDTTTAGVVGRPTGNNTGTVSQANTPTFWVSPTKDDTGFLFLVNRLPARSGQTPFYSSDDASFWLNENGYWTSYPIVAGVWYLDGVSKYAKLLNGATYNENTYTYTLDGINDYAEIVNHGTITPTQITLEVWVNPTDLSYYNHILRLESGLPTYMLVFQPEHGNCIAFGVKTTVGYVEFDVTIDPNDYLNKWTHLVATYESGTMSVYSNGVLIGTTSSQTGDILYDSTNSLLIGSYVAQDGYFYKHEIGRPAIYTTVLNASQVLSNYNTYKPLFSTVLSLDAGNPASYPGTGTVWTDTVGGKIFNLINGPGYDPNNGGKFYFSAAGGQYAICDTSLPSLSNWTIGVWHYYTGNQTGSFPCIVTETYVGGNLNYSLGNNTGNLSSGFFNGGWQTTSTYLLTPGNWYYIVGTYDGNTNKLYVNNTLVASSNYNYSPLTSGAGIRLMERWDSNDYWDGYLATVDIYDEALDSTKVTSIWNSTKSRFGL